MRERVAKAAFYVLMFGGAALLWPLIPWLKSLGTIAWAGFSLAYMFVLAIIGHHIYNAITRPGSDN